MCIINNTKTKSMKNLDQQSAIYYRNNLVSFIDWDSQFKVETLNGLETVVVIFIGTALLHVSLNELSN